MVSSNQSSASNPSCRTVLNFSSPDVSAKSESRKSVSAGKPKSSVADGKKKKNSVVRKSKSSPSAKSKMAADSSKKNSKGNTGAPTPASPWDGRLRSRK